MPTKNPRINIVVDKEIYTILKELSEERGESISSLAKKYIELGLNLVEDIGLYKLSEERLKDFSPSKTLSHEEVWS